MDHNEIENIKTKSKNMYKEVCDPTSLIYINLEDSTLKAVIDKFLNSKTSKTDLNVLISAGSIPRRLRRKGFYL